MNKGFKGFRKYGSSCCIRALLKGIETQERQFERVHSDESAFLFCVLTFFSIFLSMTFSVISPGLAKSQGYDFAFARKTEDSVFADPKKNIYERIRGNFFIQGDSSGPESLSGNSSVTGDELGGGLGFGLLYDNFRISLSGRIWSDEIDYPASGFYGNISAGPGRSDYDEYGRGMAQFDITAMDITGRYYFSNEARPELTPFLGVGGTNFNVDYTYLSDRSAGITPVSPGNSLFLSEYENIGGTTGDGGPGMGGLSTHDWADFGCSENRWGGHLDAGIEYLLGDNFSIELFTRYYFAEVKIDMAPDLTGSIVGARTADKEILDLSGFSYFFGLNFKFNAVKPGITKDEDNIEALDFLDTKKSKPKNEFKSRHDTGSEHTAVYDSNRWFYK